MEIYQVIYPKLCLIAPGSFYMLESKELALNRARTKGKGNKRWKGDEVSLGNEMGIKE